MMRKACLLLPLIFLSVPAFAESPPPKILYIGSISINPCQDAKVLADWYARLGIEMKEYQGEYYAKIDGRRDGGLCRPSEESGCAAEIIGECFRRISRRKFRRKLVIAEGQGTLA